MLEVGIWILYVALFFFLARKGSSSDSVIGGGVGFFVQSFAYVATYFSAVALVGFSGLAYMYGLQMMLVAFGNIIFGICFTYIFFAWKTKKLQVFLEARTPAELIGKGHNSKLLRVLLALIFAFFLSVYAAAVVKGAAIMLQSIVPYSLEVLIWGIILLVGIAVVWGGLRGVLLTEAMQGCVMLIGILCLIYIVLQKVGGPIDGYLALAELEASKLANNGFTKLSSGSNAIFIFSLTVVTSIAVWSQPQMIQRHFSLSSKKDIRKAMILAVSVSFFLVGGMYFIAALSRLILPEISKPDLVVPTLVNMFLPEIAKQLFTLAIVSASLSTCTALFHISASSIAEDLTQSKTSKITWFIAIAVCMLISGGTAMIESQFIALIHTTSWSVIGATAFVPYFSLILWKNSSKKAGFSSAMGGFITCMAYYVFITPQTRLFEVVNVSSILEQFPPFIVGVFCSAFIYIAVNMFENVKNEDKVLN